MAPAKLLAPFQATVAHTPGMTYPSLLINLNIPHWKFQVDREKRKRRAFRSRRFSTRCDLPGSFYVNDFNYVRGRVLSRMVARGRTIASPWGHPPTFSCGMEGVEVPSARSLTVDSTFGPDPVMRYKRLSRCRPASEMRLPRVLSSGQVIDKLEQIAKDTAPGTSWNIRT